MLITSDLFPIACVPNWQPADKLKVSDPVLKNWLLDTGSLTERLQSCCRQFTVQLLGQRYMEVGTDEALLIYSQDNKHVVREVILKGESQPWVYARTIMSKALCDDGVNRLAELGDKPLGKVIFNDPRFQRKPFEICSFNGATSLHQALSINAEITLWGRRSVFTYLEHNMTVAEIFLPQAPAYKNTLKKTEVI